MEIFRDPTSEEKRDFKVIGGNEFTIFDKFKQELNKAEKEHDKNRKPFCARCARIEFKELVENKLKGMSETVYTLDEDKLKIEIPDFDQYGEGRFKLVGTQEILVPANAAKGDKAHMEIHEDYRCNVRGCGRSISKGRKTD